MNRKEFKKALCSVLSEYGFETKKNISRVETKELIIVVATQKSNFENSYYINFGFLIKSLNTDIDNPKDNQCDVFGRFNLDINGEKRSVIEYEFIEHEEFCYKLRKSLDYTIKPVMDFGLKKYFELFPMALMTATLKAKEYLSK
ncbi:DUF4304 domain-containing protein [Clostridium sartagoforme]|uniref:DUF4304 domain-containing protein n=1 Tax=Clostridium sartagoforme TaxID=84031 RepID=UPI0031D66BB2